MDPALPLPCPSSRLLRVGNGSYVKPLLLVVWFSIVGPNRNRDSGREKKKYKEIMPRTRLSGSLSTGVVRKS